MTNRRDFIHKLGVGILMLMIAPKLSSKLLGANVSQSQQHKINLAKGETILFLGDSITDSFRRRDITKPNETTALGAGYVLLVGSQLAANHPNLRPKIYNRGVSGDGVRQLTERLEGDCFSLNPSVISILIGINDFIHSDKGQAGAQKYHEELCGLIEKIKNRVPNGKIVIMEPFALKVGGGDTNGVDLFQAAAKAAADHYGATFIALQSHFDKRAESVDAAQYCFDGIHPASAGIDLIARQWLSCCIK